MYRSNVIEESRKHEIYETDIRNARENTFVKFKARVVYSRVKQAEDKLGIREKLVGVLEDKNVEHFLFRIIHVYRYFLTMLYLLKTHMCGCKGWQENFYLK